MKRRFVLIGILLCSAAMLAACTASQDNASTASGAEALPYAASEDGASALDRSAQLEEYGRLERLRMDIPADAPLAVQAAHFSISVQEVDALAQEYCIYNGYDADTARQKAQDLLIEQYTVYAHATAQGCEVPEDRLDAIIADEQDPDMTNPADFKHFLQGFDGDEALYRSLQRQTVRVRETVELFRDDCRAAYEAEGGSDFDAYYRALVDELISAEGVEILSANP